MILMIKTLTHGKRTLITLLILLFLIGTSEMASAATYVVNDVGDGGNGTCTAANCTLRDAIITANASTDDDVIEFNVTGTISLGGTDIDILNNGNLTINGPGANLLTISANNNSRVFFIHGSAIVEINGLRIMNGLAQDGGAIFNSANNLTINNSIISNNSADHQGGGIYNSGGTLTLNNSTISGNSTNVGGNSNFGGGIRNLSGTVILNNSTVSGNSAEDQGGGIFNTGSLTVNNSTISGNFSPGGGGIFINGGTTTINQSTITGHNLTDGSGGGIHINGGNLTVNKTTISGNSAPDGGGLSVVAGGDLELNDSTVSNNSVTQNGGGIYRSTHSAGSLTLNNSTINDNSAMQNGGGIFSEGEGGATLNNVTVSNNSAPWGGGIFNSNILTLNNSTISDNSATTSGGGVFNENNTTLNNSIVSNSNSGGDCVNSGGVFTASYSLVEDGGCGVMNGVNNNKIGDPLLGTLKNNGGITETHALLSGSPAIDAGSDSLIPSGIFTDQRGLDRSADGDMNNIANVDMGAYELNFREILTVTNTADNNSNLCVSDCSLREAINEANDSVSGMVTISFASPLFDSPQTIFLERGELTLNSSATQIKIEGPGADLLTVSGSEINRIFSIDNQTVAEINGMTITDGNGGGSTLNGNGGAIYNNGNLTINALSISGNTAFQSGGGIFNSRVLTINNSTINDNSAINQGGGIRHISNILTINNSTLSGNSSQIGGGIWNNATASIKNSTISNNSATDGGGILNNQITMIHNSIVANNTSGGDCVNQTGTFTASFSLVADGSCGVIDGVDNNKTGDPLLGALQNNGGTTKTHALLPGSPAIDAADPNDFPPTDQRGFNRPADGGNSPGFGETKNADGLLQTGLPDMGSYERLAPTAAAASISGRVLSNTGRGISKAIVQITDQNGNIKTARTNHFGYYRFEGLEIGQTLIINIYAKRYEFATQVISFDNSITNLNFIAYPTRDFGRNRED